jgi:hypothetical protein
MTSYAVFLYIFGCAGDLYDPRKVLTIGFYGIGIFYGILSLGGFLSLTSGYFYFPVFIGIGLFNSLLFPTCIVVLA